MILIEQAIQIARDFAKSRGEFHPGFYYDASIPQVFKNCFYFDFIIKRKDVDVADAMPLFGGPPGFIVDRVTGQASTIAFWQLAQLQR